MLTEQIAQQATAYSYDTLPDDVVQMAKLAILDHVGCQIAGCKEPVVDILAQELAGRQIAPDELVLGRLRQSTSLHPTHVAKLHAVAAHAIDFDDTFLPAHASHIGATVIGAIFALEPASGERIIQATVTGYETAARVGQLLHDDHYQNGFHSTSTIGIFGAAAACANLLDLTVEQTRMALGLAATQAAGLKNTFGTMAKPFNAGNAASSAVMAARLVKRGFTAPVTGLEDDKGYLDLFLGLPEAARSVLEGSSYTILENRYKYHAACLATHPMIDGLGQLMDEDGVAAQNVTEIAITVHPLLKRTASIIEPQSGLNCKFSFPQIAASVLCGLNMAADSTYSDDILVNQPINNLRQCVTVSEDESLPREITKLHLTLSDGKTVSHDCNFYAADNSVEAITPRLTAKFITNATSVMEMDAAEALKQTIFDLEVIY